MRLRKLGLAFFALLALETGASHFKQAHADGKQLWNHWYTITLAKKIPYAFYNDKAEIKDGQVHFQHRIWKKEEGYINEEQVGALSKDDALLTPLFYNLVSNYRTTQIKVDGTVKDGKMLLVKARSGEKDIPAVKRSIAKGVIFSELFPVWLGRKLGSLSPKKTVTFMTIIEDDIENGFPTVSGQVRLESPDEFATKSKTRKLSVRFRDQPSTWYVETNGSPVRIVLPVSDGVVDRVTEKVAMRFLDESPTDATPARPEPKKAEKKNSK